MAVSNSTEALRARGSLEAKARSGSRCVVATTSVPRSASVSRIAWASAAPSSGSVPAPSSSTSTSERASASASTSRICFTNAEKVERFSATDCSSPMMA